MALRGFTKFEDPVTSHHKILNVGKESRCGHKNAPIVQDKFPNYPMETKDTSESYVCKGFSLNKSKNVDSGLSRSSVES